MTKAIVDTSIAKHHSHLMLRGGRLTKWQGRVASIAPHMSDLGGTVSMAALGMMLAIGGSILSTGSAQAGTCPPPGGTNVTCSNPADPTTDTTQAIGNGTVAVTVTTNPGFGIDTSTSGGNAFTLNGAGGTVFVDNNQSLIKGATNGVYAKNAIIGGLSITTTGVVTGAIANGIFARNDGTGGLSITTTGVVTGAAANGIYALLSNAAGAGGLTINTIDVTSGAYGIFARNTGTGGLSITTTGKVTGTKYNGIYAVLSNAAGAGGLNINSADVTGATNGIFARNVGTGGMSITTTGVVTGTAANGIAARLINANGTGGLTINSADVTGATNGIFARNYGTGGLSITTTGKVTGTNGRGIYARLSNTAGLGDLTVNAKDVMGGIDGIFARNDGTGGLSITTTGKVTGTNGRGIYARLSNTAGLGDIAIKAKDVSGGTDGIYARTYGTGGLSITTTGMVSGTNGKGIYAQLSNAAGLGNIAINAKDVMGGTDGIFARNYGTGGLSITTTGMVTGTNTNGIYAGLTNSSGAGDLAVTAKDVSGGTDGIYASSGGTGGLSITSTGMVTGTNGRGIYAQLSNTTGLGDIAVNAKDVTGNTNGIVGSNYGTGGLSITTTGTVKGTALTGIVAFLNKASGTGAIAIKAADVTGGTYGIAASNYGTGGLSITTTGVVTGTSYNGINASLTNSSGAGDLTVNAKDVTGGTEGIYARSGGTGSLSITTTGVVTGTNGRGINAQLSNAANSSDIAVNAKDVMGGTDGIYARNYGTGGLSITTTGMVTGKNNNGIYAGLTNTSGAGNIAINAVDVTGQEYGIVASSGGTGGLSITTTGMVSGTNRRGIYAQLSNAASAGDIAINTADVTGGTSGIFAINNGTGDLSITTTGTVKGTKYNGIVALQTKASGAGDIAVNAKDVTGDATGIYARNYGTGGLSITTTGVVTGTSANGIDARLLKATVTGDIAVNAKDVTGNTNGIVAHNAGTGGLSITTTGMVTGTNRNGIEARLLKPTGTGDIAVNAKDVTGGTNGIFARNAGTGGLSITTTGKVTGTTANGIDAQLSNAANLSDLAVAAKDVSGGTDGIYASSGGTGGLSITSTGMVTGTGGKGIYAQLSNAAGTGDIAVNAKDITGGGDGINADNRGTGGLSITTTGMVTGKNNNGIYARLANYVGTGDIAIKSVDITGQEYGIFARNYGTGGLSITTTGMVTGTNISGIYAGLTNNSGTGNIAINAADVTGQEYGIFVRNAGTGGLSITTTGMVTGTKFNGIFAQLTNAANSSDLAVNTKDVMGGIDGIFANSGGTGVLSITSTGMVTGTNGKGINAQLSSTTGLGDIAVNAKDVMGGTDGINARNNGTGGLSITTTGIVTGTKYNGIVASLDNTTGAGNIAINAADVTGQEYGIFARSYGTGGLSITATGMVSGTNTRGIYAQLSNAAGAGDIAINTADVTGGTSGIFAINSGTGDLSITTTGTVKGTKYNGIVALQTKASGAGDIAVNAKDVTGDATGIYARNYGTGSLSITTTGVVTGTSYNGIYARLTNSSGAGDLTVNAKDVTGATNGIVAHNAGTGGLSITTTGMVTGTTDNGINARLTNAVGTGVIQVKVKDVTGGTNGIFARNYGTGGLSITTTGVVTGTSANGIDARLLKPTGTGDIAVNAKDVTGNTNGIIAVSAGTGGLSITTTGMVTGTNGRGIYARLSNAAGAGGITINSADVTGGTNGIFARNYGTGTTNITTSGVVQGATNAILAVSTTGLTSITNQGTLRNTSGLTSGRVVTASGGPVNLVNNGLIAGTVAFGNGNDVFTNNGTWNSIGGVNDFGGGSDLVVNASNTMLIGGNNAALTEITTFNNLEQFTNTGTVTLVDGGLGDIIQTSGAATFAAGSTLRVDAGGAGLSDQFIAGGAVTLNNALLNVNFITAPTLGTRYTIVTGSSVSGSFTYTDQLVTAFYGLRDGYTANSAYVELTQIRTLASAGQTPNQISTAVAADNVVTPNALKLALLQLPDDATARSAFDQLSGEIHSSARTAMAEDSRLQRNAVLSRLSNGSDGSAVWGQAFGNWGTSDSNRNVAKLDHDTLGFMIGTDFGLGDNITLGITGGYLDSDLKVGARNSKGSTKTIQGLAYIGGRFGGFGIKAGLGYAKADINISRRVAFSGFSDALRADYNGSVLQGFAELGYKLPLGSWQVEPFASLTALRVKTDAFVESGGPAALGVAKGNKNSTISVTGLRFETALGASFSIVGMAGWQHGFGNLDPAGQHNFAGGTPFSILGTAQSRNAGVANIEARLTLSKNTIFSLAYDGVLGDAGQNHALKMGLKINF